MDPPLAVVLGVVVVVALEPPHPASTGSLPHSASKARRARDNACELKGSCSAPDAPCEINSARQSDGSRSLTKARKAPAILSGSCDPTSRNENLALACAGSTVFDPLPV